MKEPDLRKWTINTETEGLLFFSQLVEELLFTYTLDTYKKPALNTNGLCRELLITIRGVEDGTLKKGNIKPITEELILRLQKDPVIDELFAEATKGEFTAELATISSIAELKNKVRYFFHHLEPAYLTKTIKLLRKNLERGEESYIVRLTKNWLIELGNLGYSNEYIYFENLNFFFSDKYPKKYPKNIKDLSSFDSFMKCFTGKSKKWSVVFRVGNDFAFLKDFASQMGIKIDSQSPKLNFSKKSTRVSDFLKANGRLSDYLSITDIEAFDSQSARHQADDRLLLIDSLAKYHVHRTDFKWSEEALVFEFKRTTIWRLWSARTFNSKKTRSGDQPTCGLDESHNFNCY